MKSTSHSYPGADHQIYFTPIDIGLDLCVGGNQFHHAQLHAYLTPKYYTTGTIEVLNQEWSDEYPSGDWYKLKNI